MKATPIIIDQQSRNACIVLAALLTVSFVSTFIGRGRAVAATKSANATAAESNSGIRLNALAQIQRDYETGDISFGEAQVLKVRAIRKSASLPEKYRSASVSGAPIDTQANYATSRCATATLLEARLAMDNLGPSLQTELQGLLTRPAAQVVFDSPRGHFKLHYDTTGLSAVPLVDGNLNGVPDFIDRIALYADSSWSAQVELFGYLPPPSDNLDGGDSRYDIYFDDIPYFGFTQAEALGPETWNDITSFIVLNKDFVGLSNNSDPEGSEIGAAKVTVAHEFQHAVQFAYDFSDEVWFMESSATWMEEMMFDEVNDNYNYFPQFHNSPQTALTRNLSPHYYATFVWPLYLSQRFDTSLMRRAWEGARFKDVMEALADSLPVLHGVSRDSAFTEFIVWAYLTGQRDDGQHFEEAAAYPDMRVADTVTNLPVFNRQIALKPQGYGSAFARFLPTGDSGTLKVSFQGNVNRNWGATVIATRGNADHDIFTIQLDDSSFGTLFIPTYEQYTEITLAGMNLSAYSVSAEYVFSAEIVSGAAVSGIAVGDTIAYTLQDNHVGYKFTNLGINVDSFLVSTHDSSGWGGLIVGPEVVTLAPGASTTAVVSVMPPAGTLPLSRNSVTISVMSLTDSTAVDSVMVHQVVEVYRGDPDWDGKLSIGDVTYLVAWMFTGGPGPIPERIAGDSSCDGVVNIGDITHMVTVLFQGNALPACNAVDSL